MKFVLGGHCWDWYLWCDPKIIQFANEISDISANWIDIITKDLLFLIPFWMLIVIKDRSIQWCQNCKSWLSDDLWISGFHLIPKLLIFRIKCLRNSDAEWCVSSTNGNNKFPNKTNKMTQYMEKHCLQHPKVYVGRQWFARLVLRHSNSFHLYGKC